ncbi:MAG: WD40 repeat domain-containing protein [Leptospirales bacterium]|nr:WD40 repeat domain-containing protein [Leptospirales bacterium]
MNLIFKPMRLLLLTFLLSAFCFHAASANESERPGKPLLVEQLGHASRITSVAVSPDSRFVLTGAEDWTVRLWDFKTGRLIRVFSGHTFVVSSVAFSADSRFALSGSEDRTVRLWDIETGVSRVLAANMQDRSVYVRFSGKRALVSQFDYTIAISPETGKEIGRLATPLMETTTDGKWVAGQPAEGSVAIYNDAGTKVREFIAHSKWIRDMDFSADGSRIVTVGDDEGIRVWNTRTGERIARLTNQTNLQVVALSPDGKSVFAVKGFVNGKMTPEQFGSHLIDIASGKTLCETKATGNAAQFTRDGKHIVLADHKRNASILRASDCGLARKTEGWHDKTSHVRISPAGSTLLVAHSDSVYLIDFTTGRLVKRLRQGASAYDVAFSADGKRAFTAASRSIETWNTQDGSLLRKLDFPEAVGYPADFSADGKLAAIIGPENQVIVVSTENGSVLQKFAVESGPRTVVLSADGSLCAIEVVAHSMTVWSTRTGRLVARLVQPLSHLDSLLFSRDASTLIALTFDGDASLIQFISVADPRVSRVAPGPKRGVTGNALSSDGRFLLLPGDADRSVKLHDSVTGRFIGSSAGHSHYPESVEFSADGKLAIAGHAGDDTLRIYSLPSMEHVGTLRILESGTIFYTPDGRFDTADANLKSRVVFRQGGTSKLLSIEEIPRDLFVPGLFAKTTQATIQPASQTSDPEKSFLAYQKAILNSDGKTAVRYVNSQTLKWFASIFAHAREADKATLLKLSFMNRLMALSMRARTPTEKLLSRDYSGESVFVYGVENGMIGKSSVIDLRVEKVTINDKFAKVSVSRGGKETAPFHFYLESGIWKVDLEQLSAMSNMTILEMIKQRGMTEEEFIFKALESLTGKKVTQEIYKPPVSRSR